MNNSLLTNSISYDKSVYAKIAKIAKAIIDFEKHSDEVHNENDRKTSAELVADYATGNLMVRVLNENISHEDSLLTN